MSSIYSFKGRPIIDAQKYIEFRWGLTIVSFLPPEVYEVVKFLQKEISNRWNKSINPKHSLCNFNFEFYHPSHLHCTHFTLTRSNPDGPVMKSEFVKSRQNLFSLFNIIGEATSQIKEIKVTLDRISMSSRNRIGLILLGKCSDNNSIEQRSILLDTLNKKLPKYFNISKREWDDNRTKFNEVHTCIGFQKREIPYESNSIVNEIESIEFNPISFMMKKVSLVHHKRRTLAFPQEGIFDFPFGEKLEMEEDKFIHEINLS